MISMAGMKPQTFKILRHLQSVGNISGMEAQGLYRCRSLPKRISELRDHGFNITSVLKNDRTGQRYARYTLAA